jgi:hypothetical protein
MDYRGQTNAPPYTQNQQYQQNQQNPNKQCETGILTYFLIAIFVINVFVVFYSMYSQYSVNSDLVDVKFKTSIPILIYYIIIITITYKFKCTPMASLLYHPIIFSIVLIYLFILIIGGVFNLVWISNATADDVGDFYKDYTDYDNTDYDNTEPEPEEDIGFSAD